VAIINPDVCAKEPEAARLVNAESVRHAAGLAGNALLVFISSDYVFDGRKGNYSETDLPNPVNVYGETKLAGEWYASQANRRLIVRTALFGAGLPTVTPTRTEQQLEALARGQEVVAACDQVGTPLWTRTLARLVLRMAEQGVTGIAHAAAPEPVDKAELLRRLATAAGIQTARVRGVATAELKPLAERPLNVALRCSSVVANLPGYPMDLAEELYRYANQRRGAGTPASGR
jgi:dTDP-4-dehydrorhamnose reductase